MNNKRAISVIAVIMAILMLFGLVASVLPVRARAVSQEDIDQLQQQKSALAQRVQEAEDRVGALREEESGVLEEVAALDEKDRAAQEALALVDQEIAMYDEMIADKQAELDLALKTELNQRDRYRVRVRAMEESGGYNFLAILLHSRSFSEFLSALEDMEKIMESDKRLEEAYRQARQEAERVKAEYEAVRADCEKKQKDLRQEQAEIQQKIDEAKERLEELSDEIEKAIEQYRAEQEAENRAADELTELIRRWEDQKRAEEEERRRREEEEHRNQQPGNDGENTGNTGEGAENGNGGETGGGNGGETGGESGGETGGETGGESGGETGGGNGGETGGESGGNEQQWFGFTWPVPCSTRVTSRFGYRIDPFTQNVTGHAGIDIDGYGNDGQPIVAAAAGTVIVANYGSTGYGNYVTIDHGNGYSTVYAHMSDLAVSYGEWVEAGQTIGFLGSTGRSTGTHCHFEIRSYGTPIDPEQFFSGLSHWNC